MSFKKMRHTDSIDEAELKSKLAAVAEYLGREVRVFINSTQIRSPETSSSSNEEPDKFYDLTPEDYYHISSHKIGANSQVLKTRKIREAEEAARRAKLTKATIRVRFPDDYILETYFHPSEKLQSLFDLLTKVIACPDLPFYLYTTPPKEQIKDMSKDFYTARFVPGAVVYFSYDKSEVTNGSDAITCPFLRDEIKSLYDLHLIDDQAEVVNPQIEEPARVMPSPPEAKPITKKTTKPKWFKL